MAVLDKTRERPSFSRQSVLCPFAIMSAYTFGAALELTSSPKLTSPPAAKRKEPVERQSAIELQDYIHQVQSQQSRYSNGTNAAASQAPGKVPTTTIKTPSDLEMSRPPSPSQAAEVVPSWSFPSMNKYRILAACTVYFGNGLNDACKCTQAPRSARGI